MSAIMDPPRDRTRAAGEDPGPIVLDAYAAHLARLACPHFGMSAEKYASELVRRVAASDLRRASHREYIEGDSHSDA